MSSRGTWVYVTTHSSLANEWVYVTKNTSLANEWVYITKNSSLAEQVGISNKKLITCE